MASNTGIAWCDHTHNLWWGCVERGPGCLHCYARELAKRWGWDVWGPEAERRIFDEAHARDLDRYAQIAAEAGESQRVFVGSMMDLAEERDDLKPIVRAFLRGVERYLPTIDFLCLTKRPEHYEQILRDCFPSGRLPSNVWLGCSAVTQKEAEPEYTATFDVEGRCVAAETPLPWGTAISASYFADALKALVGDRVELVFTHELDPQDGVPIAPLLIRDGAGRQAVIMPMRHESLVDLLKLATDGPEVVA